VDAEAFSGLCEVARVEGGLLLHPEALALVERGIAPRLDALGLPSALDYLRVLQAGLDAEELGHFLDAVTTTYTGFFREPEHLERVRVRTQRALSQGQRRFRFWSAACSGGEEPYSLAMVLADCFAGEAVDWKILASDVSGRMVRRAQAARYTPLELEPVEPGLRERSFDAPDATGARQVCAALREKVVVRRLNLVATPYVLSGPLDAVLCRNVMFHLTKAAQQLILREVTRLLRPGGLLCLGMAETLSGLDSTLTALGGAAFEKSAARGGTRDGARP
jgi:chemotaxis protein methyltransferase CheR